MTDRPRMHGDVVLFLGAGFSRAAGLPIMRDFGTDSEAELSALIARHGDLDPTSPRHRYAAARLIDLATTYQRFRELCARSGTRKPEAWRNLETLFCVAEALAESGYKEVLLDGQAYTITTILRDLQLWTWKIYQRMPVAQTAPDVEVDAEAYERFFGLIRTHKLTQRINVITTNYDLVYEYLSFKHLTPCTYPVDWEDGFTVSQSPSPYLIPWGAGPSPTVVCKLHGSINYFEDSEAEEPHRLLVAPDLGGGPPVGKSGGVVGRPALLALDAIWALEKRYGAGITPAIIPPSYAKLGRRKWLRTIWNEARSALQRATAIVFIGYSLPPSDGFMSALLSGAAAVRTTDRNPAVYVVDPCKSAYDRIAEIYGTQGTRRIGRSFEEAVRGDLPALFEELSALSPLERESP